MKKKGRITLGADADITIFDPARIIDRPTIENPARPSDGVTRHLGNLAKFVENGNTEFWSIRFADRSPTLWAALNAIRLC